MLLTTHTIKNISCSHFNLSYLKYALFLIWKFQLPLRKQIIHERRPDDESIIRGKYYSIWALKVVLHGNFPSFLLIVLITFREKASFSLEERKQSFFWLNVPLLVKSQKLYIWSLFSNDPVVSCNHFFIALQRFRNESHNVNKRNYLQGMCDKDLLHNGRLFVPSNNGTTRGTKTSKKPIKFPDSVAIWSILRLNIGL